MLSGVKIIFIGPPGSGKGTQSASICKKYSLEHLSSGDVLREEINSETELGKKIKETVNNGELVSDDIVLSCIEKRIRKLPENKGFVLDGYPRNINQAIMLDDMLTRLNLKIDIVIYFNVNIEVILKRLSGRRIHPKSGRTYHITDNPPRTPGLDDVTQENLIQRADDTAEIINRRYQVFLDEISLLSEYYRKKNIFCEIESEYSIDEVNDKITKALNIALH